MYGDTCDLMGVKDGVETKIGTMPLPPKMKLKEIVRSYFSGSIDDDMSDASYAYAVGEELINWMIANGWAISPEVMASKCLTKKD